MRVIKLQNNLTSDVTVLSNTFIDRYMIEANGEFVKIYLYILRLSADPSISWTLPSIMDKLECTSKDINRALNYWSKKGLLICEYNDSKELTALSFVDPGKQNEENVEAPREEVRPATRLKAVHIADSAEETAEGPSASVPDRNVSLAPARLRSLKSNAEAKQLLFIAEQYLQHPLSATEVETILYFYDTMKFSVDLLDYLIEYCVARGSKSIHYIRKVGFSWADSGITTVKEAKASSKLYNKNCFAIMKAYGLNGRDPGTIELDYIQSWISDYPFTIDIILEAVNRTMKQIHEPKFAYTDMILKRWMSANVRTIADIEALDKERMEKKNARGGASKTQAPKNAFNNFTNREYNYSDLEKQLLENK